MAPAAVAVAPAERRTEREVDHRRTPPAGHDARSCT